jgi:hypothetical protein
MEREVEYIYIVVGVHRHFTGDCEQEIITCFKDHRKAQLAGSEWVKDKNEQYHLEGRNIHAYYKIEMRMLR